MTNKAMVTGAFDVDRVKAKLPAFNAAGVDLGDTAIVAYRQYYGITFEEEFPDLRVIIGTEDISGYRIAIHHYLQQNTAKGTVFLLHGYYDHVGIFNHAIRSLLEEGYSVVTFDLPGHGLSSGDPVAIPDFHRYRIVFTRILDVFQSCAAKPWFAAAQSTGGAIVIDYVLAHASKSNPIPFCKAVLFAPLIRPRGFTVGRYVHKLVSPFADYVARGFAKNSHSKEFLHFLKHGDPLQSHRLSARWVGALKNWIPEIENQPPTTFAVMIIQGQQDGTVEYEYNLAMLRQKFPDAELVLLPSGRHQLVNESPELRKEIFGNMLRFFAR